jgi:signal transduction histidine kinase
MNIQKKMLIVFIPLIVLSSVITNTLVFIYGSDELKSGIKEDRLFAVEGRKYILENFIDKYKDKLQDIGALSQIQQLSVLYSTLNGDMDQNTYLQNKNQSLQFFKNVAEHDENIFQIRYIDGQGQEILKVVSESGLVTIIPDNELQNKSDRSYFKSTIGIEGRKIWVSDIELNEEHGIIEVPHKSVIRFSTPVFASSGITSGILIINIDTSIELEKIMNSSKGKITIVDDSGEFKIDSDSSKLFSSQVGTDFNIFTEQPELHENLKKFNSLVWHDQEDTEFRLWTKLYYNPSDPERFWVILNQIPDHEYLDLVTNLQIINGTISLVVTSIIVLAVFMFSRNLSRPIEELTVTSQKLARGDYNIKITEHKTTDEISQLTQSFNVMLDSLKKKEFLERKTKSLEYMDKEKEEFSAMISHELKTPLIPIRGYAELFLDGSLGNLTKEQKETMQVIYDNSIRLMNLIQNLLDVRKIELKRLKLDIHPVSVHKIVKNCIDNFKPVFKQKGITLVDETTDIKTLCDQDRILQVLNNILSNAIKFVPSNNGKIIINNRIDDNYVVISVKDNGIGIPHDLQKKLFKKFYQIDTTLTRKPGGTGLGLAISRGIIEAHKGKIWIESLENSGTTIHFSLPLGEKA